MHPVKPKSNTEMETKWQAQDDLRMLTQAAEIKKDKARYARALAMAREQLKALQAISTTKE